MFFLQQGRRYETSWVPYEPRRWDLSLFSFIISSFLNYSSEMRLGPSVRLSVHWVKTRRWYVRDLFRYDRVQKRKKSRPKTRDGRKKKKLVEE